MQVHDSLIELVGNTPLVRLRRVTQILGAGAPAVLAKVEYFNPGGSVKDRIALRMIEAAERSGQLRPGGIIIEPTSGNTGVGLAIVAAEKGYRCLFVCPDKVGQDKISVLRAYGAEVIVCPGAVPPGRSAPEASAASTMRSAIRSFTDPPGLKYSTLASTAGAAPWPSTWVTARSRSSGVLPTSSISDSWTCISHRSPGLDHPAAPLRPVSHRLAHRRYPTPRPSAAPAHTVAPVGDLGPQDGLA